MPAQDPSPLVTNQERLAEIKATLHHWDAIYAPHGLAPLPPAVAAQESAQHLNRAQIDFLVGEVDRLRGLLARLEWAGTYCERDREMACCPVCEVVADSEVVGQLPHLPDCWLAAELGRTQKGAPPKGAP